MDGSSEYSIGPYRIVRRLGFGRKSEVLLATRLFPGNFERRVVIKRLLAKCEDDPERQAVIAAEALAYARVAHPAIVQLFDFFSHEGHLALVLEYVDGVSLTKLLEGLRARRETLSDGVAFFIASRIFAALAAVHTAKDPRTGETTPVIHRDVSPSNVLVPWDGFVKVGDFDMSKVIGVSGDTISGVMKGTYGYMAPEQVTGDPVTPRTDVYAGCLVLRELLLGRTAFDEKLPELELLTSMLRSQLAPLETVRAGVPRRLADAMSRGLARDPEERTLTAAEMVDVLRSLADMELAHAELIAALGRIRASQAGEPLTAGGRGLASQSPPTPPLGVVAPLSSSSLRSSRSRWSFHTPRPVTMSRQESLPPVERGEAGEHATGEQQAAPPPPAWFGDRFVSLPTALAAGGVMVLVFALARSFGGPPPEAVDEVPAAAATPLASPPPPVAPVVAPSLAVPPPEPLPAQGTIVAPVAARHHRIWVDGEVVVWSTGPTLSVPCGTHVVRIGSSGASQSIDVPCGGTITLAPSGPSASKN